jgi:hypothetical protein
MNNSETPLESALRELPRWEGQADWIDLQARLHRRRPFHLRLWKHATTLKWVSGCLGVLLLVGFWQALQGRRSVTATRTQELRTWVTAHDQATEADPFADPWAQSVAESNR